MQLLYKQISDEEGSRALTNSAWSLKADCQMMTWYIQQPTDWQVGGRCEAYMWGSGRQGQLGDASQDIGKFYFEIYFVLYTNFTY